MPSQLFGFLKVKMTARGARGSVDPQGVYETIKENWDALQEELDKLEDEQKNQIRDHFNSIIESEDDLGDILFGEIDDFESKLDLMDSEVMKAYTDELIA